MQPKTLGLSSVTVIKAMKLAQLLILTATM